MKQLTVIPRTIILSDFKPENDFIPKERELITEQDGSGDTMIMRFKLGDGITPYSKLDYVHSLVNLFPEYHLYSKNYESSLTIKFSEV